MRRPVRANWAVSVVRNDPILRLTTRIVKVSYSRIKALSPTLGDNDTACILGHVVAHEIGHLLLPRGPAFAFRHHARMAGPAARGPWRALLHGGPGSRHPGKACSS